LLISAACFGFSSVLLVVVKRAGAQRLCGYVPAFDHGPGKAWVQRAGAQWPGHDVKGSN